MVNVRYMVDDVDAAVVFYTKHFGFTLLSNAAPAFADVTRSDLQLLPERREELRRPVDARRSPSWSRRLKPHPADRRGPSGRSRAPARGRTPLSERHRDRTRGGSQILIDDPSGNPLELFQPVRRERGA